MYTRYKERNTTSVRSVWLDSATPEAYADDVKKFVPNGTVVESALSTYTQTKVYGTRSLITLNTTCAEYTSGDRE